MSILSARSSHCIVKDSDRNNVAPAGLPASGEHFAPGLGAATSALDNAWKPRTPPSPKIALRDMFFIGSILAQRGGTTTVAIFVVLSKTVNSEISPARLLLSTINTAI
jgi:hypothetical protein